MFQFDIGFGVEEENFVLVVDVYGYLVLFFDVEQQGYLCLLYLGWSQCFVGFQVGVVEQGEYDVGQVEEDQGDCCQYGQVVDQYVLVGQVVFEGMDVVFVLQGWCIEVNLFGSKGGVYWGVGYVVYGVIF